MTKVLLFVLLLAALIIRVIRSRRRVAREEAAAAVAKARTARRNRVPAVSNNLKGVTASQTMEPYRPTAPTAADGDQRVA